MEVMAFIKAEGGDPYWQVVLREVQDRLPVSRRQWSIVKGLVKLHYGDIDIRSRLGEGTRVTVSLPIDCESHKAPADPIRLVTERAGDLAAAANVLVKKSA